MAEPKTKGTNGNHVSEKNPNKNSKLWQLLTLAKEVTKDVEAIQDYDRTIEGRKTLELELEAKDKENKRLRDVNEKVFKQFSEHKAQAAKEISDQKEQAAKELSEQKAQAEATTQGLVAGFEHRYKAFESDKTAFESMEKEVKEITAKLDTSAALEKAKTDENDKLKQLLGSAEAHAQSQASEIKEMSTECETHRSRLQTNIAELHACKTKLAGARSDLGEDLLREYGPEDLKKLGLDLRALSKKCHALVMEYFNDQDGAEDAASEIQELKEKFPKVPLSTATTRAAAQMRCAVAEAVFAEVLISHIFVPFYLPAGSREAASSLLGIFGDDEHKRTVYRCQILRSMTDKEEIARVQDEIVRKASSEVRSTLPPLVVAFKQAGFYQAVPNFFKEAQALWVNVQRSRDLIMAEPPDVNEVQPPGKHDEYDQSGGLFHAQKGAKGPKGTIAAVLFPQVGTHEELIFNGMALWSNQAALAAASAVQEAPANGASSGEPMKQSASRRRSVAGPDSPFRNK